MARPNVYATTPTHLFTQTLNTQRLTASADAMGGVSKAYAANLSSVACRVQPLSTSEAVRYGRESTRGMFRFFVAGTVDIVQTDRIQFDSRFFDIIDLVNPQDADVILTIVAEEANG